MSEAYISTTEAAEELGITRQRVLQLIEAGKLQAQKFANVYMIPRSGLEAVRDRPTGRPPKPQKPATGQKRAKKGGKE